MICNICNICKKLRAVSIEFEQDEDNNELIQLASKQLQSSDEFCRGHSRDTIRQEVPQAFYDAFKETQA
jgi:hypothetical protein